MRLASNGRLKNLKRSHLKRTRRKISIVLWQCTQGIEAFWWQINWLQSRTQFQCCYKFSRCASKAASPTIGDVKAFDKLTCQLRSQTVKLHFSPLTGPLRTIGFPDVIYRNNEDGSSQKGMTVFLSEVRERLSKD